MALEEKVFVTSGKKKASVRNETDAVSVTRPKIMRQNQNTLPPRLLSHPCHEVEVCRGKEVSEAKGNHGSFLRQPCRYFLKVPARDRLVNIGIRPSAKSIKNGTGCKAGDKCLFAHCKVDEQPNKKPQKNDFPKRRDVDDKKAVAFVKSAPQLGCVSQDLDALVSQRGKQSLKNPMQQVLGSI